MPVLVRLVLAKLGWPKFSVGWPKGMLPVHVPLRITWRLAWKGRKWARLPAALKRERFAEWRLYARL